MDIKDKEKLEEIIKILDNMSMKYISNTNLYMKINTTVRLLQDIKCTIDFIEENNNV